MTSIHQNKLIIWEQNCFYLRLLNVWIRNAPYPFIPSIPLSRCCKVKRPFKENVGTVSTKWWNNKQKIIIS